MFAFCPLICSPPPYQAWRAGVYSPCTICSPLLIPEEQGVRTPVIQPPGAPARFPSSIQSLQGLVQVVMCMAEEDQ